MFVLYIALCIALPLYCATCDKSTVIGGDIYCKKGCAVSSGVCQKCTTVNNKADCDLSDRGHFGCQWKNKCSASSCPSIAKKMKEMIKNEAKHVAFDDKQHSYMKGVCRTYGCLYCQKKESCAILSQWALILIINLAVAVFVVTVVVIIIILVLKSENAPTEKVEVGPVSSPSNEKLVASGTRDLNDGSLHSEEFKGPYLVIKVGEQNHQRSRMVNDGLKMTWEENFVFTNLGNEDDDVQFELWDGDTQLGIGGEPFLKFKKKTHVSIALKDSFDVIIGMLETNIELKLTDNSASVQIFVDRFNKAILQ